MSPVENGFLDWRVPKAYATVMCHPGHQLEDKQSASVHCDGRHWNKQPSRCQPFSSTLLPSTTSLRYSVHQPMCFGIDYGFGNYFVGWTSGAQGGSPEGDHWKFTSNGMEFVTSATGEAAHHAAVFSPPFSLLAETKCVSVTFSGRASRGSLRLYLIPEDLPGNWEDFQSGQMDEYVIAALHNEGTSEVTQSASISSKERKRYQLALYAATSPGFYSQPKVSKICFKTTGCLVMDPVSRHQVQRPSCTNRCEQHVYNQTDLWIDSCTCLQSTCSSTSGRLYFCAHLLCPKGQCSPFL